MLRRGNPRERVTFDLFFFFFYSFRFSPDIKDNDRSSYEVRLVFYISSSAKRSKLSLCIEQSGLRARIISL